MGSSRSSRLLVAGAIVAANAAAGPVGLVEAQVPAARHELRWTRAPGAEACIDARALADAVGARLGRPGFDGGGAAAIVIEAHVRPTGAGWHVAIAVRDADGTSRGARELEQPGADCRALDESLALVLALIVDPDAAGGPVAPVPVPEPGPRVARTPWRGEMSLVATAAIGVLPGAAAGARLGAVVDPPGTWPVAIGASWWAEDEAEANARGEGVRLRMWHAGAAMCTPALRRGRARGSLCGGGEVGRVRAEGFGFDRNRSTAATIAAVTVAARAGIAVRGPAFVAIELAAAVPVVRPRFVFDPSGTLLYQAAPFSLAGAIGVGVHF